MPCEARLAYSNSVWSMTKDWFFVEQQHHLRILIIGQLFTYSQVRNHKMKRSPVMHHENKSVHSTLT